MTAIPLTAAWVAATVAGEIVAGDPRREFGGVSNSRGVLLSMTDCYRQTSYGEPIVALKSYILSPFVDEEHVEAVVRKVLEARERIDGNAAR